MDRCVDGGIDNADGSAGFTAVVPLSSSQMCIRVIFTLTCGVSISIKGHSHQE